MPTIKREEIDINCSKCGYNRSLLIISSGTKGSSRTAYCKKCNNITLSEFTLDPEYNKQADIIEYDDNIKCEFCGFDVSTVTIRTDKDGTAMISKCKRCNQVTSIKNKPAEQSSIVTCPFCQSTNCKKISGASKIGKVALFGVFAAGSVSKTWHCNNCGSNFG